MMPPFPGKKHQRPPRKCLTLGFIYVTPEGKLYILLFPGISAGQPWSKPMLKELRTQHRSIIQMSFNGFKNNEIAEKTGMSQGTISQILRCPLGQAYLNGLHDRAQENTLDVRKKLISLNKDALSTIERILNPAQKAPFNVQLTAAKDVLDRNGYKPSDKFEIDVFSHKTDDEIEAEIRAMEAAIARNQLANENELPAGSLPESAIRGDADFNGDESLLESQELHPFPLDESAEQGQSDLSRPETSLAASSSVATASRSDLSNTNDPIHSSDLSQNNTTPHFSQPTTDPGLPPDVQSKLADESFDPFQNI
jgi:hypothetical protein